MSEIQDFDQLYDRADREISNISDELDKARVKLAAKDDQLKQAQDRVAELEGCINFIAGWLFKNPTKNLCFCEMDMETGFPDGCPFCEQSVITEAVIALHPTDKE